MTARSATVLVLAGLVAAAALGSCGDEDPPGTPRGDRGFEERTEEAGIRFRTTFLPKEQGEKFRANLYDHGCGVAVSDFDGDGRDDVYFCNQLGPNALYRNLGDGRFEDVTAAAGADLALDDRVSMSAVWADTDNDGRADLYVTSTRGGNVLFHNEGGGRFRDVTKEAGVGVVAHTQHATFFDADGDGDLDLLVSNTAKWTLDTYEPEGGYYVGVLDVFAMIGSEEKEENVFFRNLGGGRFEDATKESGLAGTGWSGDTAVFDFDEDGDADVAVANMFGATHLYENAGAGRFEDVARHVLGRVSWGAVGCKAFDHDNDGHLDLLLSDMHSDMWMSYDYVPKAEESRKKHPWPLGPRAKDAVTPRQAAVLERIDVPWDDVVFGNTFFRATGAGTFEEVSDRAGLETLWPWGIAVGDFDGDTYQDVYLASGMGYPFDFVASPLLMNRGDGTFVDRAGEAGLDPLPGGNFLPGRWGGRALPRSSRCAATADFDADGRLDLLVGNFNDRPFLLMNRWPKRNWIGFRLAGTTSNRDAIGAVVRLKVGAKTLTRHVEAATGYLAQSSAALHFGLGDAERIDSCEIRWPGGRRQVLTDLALGTVHRVEEPR